MRYGRLLAVLHALPFLYLSSIALANPIRVTLNTTPLQGAEAAPFSLIFQLTDGSGSGDGNNTVTLSNFQFGSGHPSGLPTTFGAVSGGIGTELTLVDTSFLSYFIQPFLPGAILGFTLSMTNNVDAGGIPDGFGFSIGDNTGQAIPTQAGPFADMFLTIAFDSSQPSIMEFASDTSRLPAGGGGPIAIAAPTVDPVPEPSSFVLTASVFGFVAAWSWRGCRYVCNSHSNR